MNGPYLMSGNYFGTKFCEILGINPKNVRKLTIECDCRALVTVVVERYADENEGAEIAALVKNAVEADNLEPLIVYKEAGK